MVTMSSSFERVVEMARMNTKAASVKNTAKSPVSTKKSGKKIATHEGGTGFKRTAKGELFLAAVTSLNEDTFYESAEDRQGALRVRITVVGEPEAGAPTTVLFFSQMPAHDADTSVYCL